MIGGEIGTIALYTPHVAVARAAVAAHENECVKSFGMIEAQKDRRARTDAAAHEHGSPNSKFVHDTDDVVAHVFQCERRGHLRGSPIAAKVDSDDAKPRREVRCLVEPEVVVEGI